MKEVKYSPEKIQIQVPSKFEVAKRYYGVLFKVNNIKVKPLEIDLVAFSAINGTITTPPVREEFIRTFQSSKFSFNNMSSRLQKLNILVKKEGKIKVNPIILPDFSSPSFKIEITIINDTLNPGAES